MTVSLPASRTRHRLALLALVASGLLLPGCKSAETYREDADREAYALVDARRAELFGNEPGFNIAPPENSLRQRLLRGEVTQLDPLTLVDCLVIAAENNRDYQTRKERLFLEALDLTLERWRFSNQWSGSLGATVTGDGTGATDVSFDNDLTLSRLLGIGTSIVAGIGTSLFRMITTGDGWDALSNVSLSITQPLMRGAGVAIVTEPLTQAERNLVYEVRNFERFRRTFAVDVANQVYRLIQTADSIYNQQQNIIILEDVRKRNEAFAEAGQLTDIEVDQARQDELDSRNSLLVSEQNFQAQLDDFKIFLGLPIDVGISLDPQETDRLEQDLKAGDPVLDGLTEEQVIETALAHRLDYLTAVDGVYDSERQVMVAADALEMGLDLSASISGTSPEGRPTGYRSGDFFWSAGIDFDLPLDRIPERNAYRSTLISLDAAVRNLELFEDQIRASLRNLIRNVRTARETYEIQVNAETLAARRVESARLNLEAGRAQTRDVLEAQRSLLSAQNASTRALIDYALARLDFYLEMEALLVDQSGFSVDNSILGVQAPQPEEEE